uniref:Uncharacterized protein n=1 Tax=Rhizophora mucronata TaxID=61149 RepID=A0A2P2P2D0_RHIMU
MQSLRLSNFCLSVLNSVVFLVVKISAWFP